MKGFRLLLAVCLAPLALYASRAEDNADAARAAVRRVPNNSVTVTRQKPVESASATPTQSTQTISRSTNLPAKSTGTTPENNRTPTPVREDATSASVSTRSPSVTTRTSQPAPGVRTRTASQPATTRTAQPAQSRSTTARATVSATPRVANTARTASTRAALSRGATQRTISRAADADSVATARAEMMSHDAKKCREVYYNCMDEFCANKDALLKRCACSARIHEFDSTKKNLAEVEDKMLAFNQRLLTVNMDKEDAAALYKATEGELAFNQKDTSQSKKMLDEIAKKLNTSFNDSNFDRSLSPISLSLNVDAAFDSIDSMQGAATTSKTGTALYSAALPVCREMAREVCTDDDLSIAESGYQIVIEQDCNTVSKSYQTQVDQARERVREGGALLDMSRLDIHQKRNADDTLTCKKKMLDMLTDSSVCGSGMSKCLDVTGRYIDPSTGEAFLTNNLAQLESLITRPTGNQTWAKVPGNNIFVSYLNSKKKFLEPAMENCQNIADTVWTEFLDDALAQIKLAQESKLEDMRQSCTALTTKCLSDTAKSLADFDARALSIFGVKADKTVNAMCADVTNACNALLQNTSVGGNTDWIGGMTEITNANTYETILSTCREVGRACIVQVCSATSGNFGLCESIQSSVNRKSIINRNACWDEVVRCIADAGTDKITEIMKQLGKTTGDSYTTIKIPEIIPPKTLLGRAAITKPNKWKPVIIQTDIYNNCTDGICEIYQSTNTTDFYDTIYNVATGRTTTSDGWDGSTLLVPATYDKTCTGDLANQNNVINCIDDICYDICNIQTNNPTDDQKTSCYICRIAEQIWGNCEAAPTVPLTNDAHNRILQPRDGSTTLLWWFAQNTGTSTQSDSCRDTSCPAGYELAYTQTDPDSPKVWSCTSGDISIDHVQCHVSSYNVTINIPNCCPVEYEEYKDAFGNCPSTGQKSNINMGNTHFNDGSISENKNLAIPNGNTVVATWNLTDVKSTPDGATYPAGDYALICVGTTSGTDATENYPNGQTIKCNGTFIVVNLDEGLYFTPGNRDAGTNIVDAIDENGTQCHYSLTSNGWKEDDNTTDCDITPENWLVKY